MKAVAQAKDRQQDHQRNASLPGSRGAAIAAPTYGMSFMNQNPQAQVPVQRRKNETGLPDQLKSGIESLSGIDMSDVRVHRNSSKPAQLQAHAYAQGRDIYLGPGQERHLPHEAWHVVQQAQGRVKPTLQRKSVLINDNQNLEPVINFKKCCTPVRVQAISLGWSLRPPSQELPTPVMSAMQNGTFAVPTWC